MEIIDKEKLLKAFEEVFKNLKEYDFTIMDNNVHEQCLSGRIAMYLRDALKDYEKGKIRIDVEYNRDGYDLKLENQEKAHRKNKNPYIRPDVLIHERGNNNNNILYCEIKKDSTQDEEKVKKQVYGKRGYHYGVDIVKIKEYEISLLLYERDKQDEKPTMYTYKENKLQEVGQAK